MQTSRKNTGQTVSESGEKHTEERLVHSERNLNHKVMQGNNCEGHQEDSLHTAVHNLKSGDSFTSGSTRLPSFKAEPLINYMGDSNEQQQPPCENKNDKGLVGLANLGNTCYLNSVLQALRNTTELTAFFLEGRHQEFLKGKKESNKAVILTKAYVDVLQCVWSGYRSQFIRPNGFFNDMCKAVDDTVFDQFKMKMAHDSHEFLMFMLDNLHEALAEEVNIVITRPPPVTEADTMIQKALEFWRDMFRKSYSPLIDLVFGLYQREMHCQRCNKKTYTYETFNCLKVSVPQRGEPMTLDTCLQEELKEETIDEYACDHCAPTRATAIRRTKLWKLPKILFVALKRFSPTGAKLQTPLSLNPQEEVSFESQFSSASPEPSRFKKYTLFATIDHFGSSHGGHYTSQAKNPLTGKWHGYDDENVYDIETPSIGRSTYICCFRASS
jgi:ubiquitin carboxyl-terminal hydrolase 8